MCHKKDLLPIYPISEQAASSLSLSQDVQSLRYASLPLLWWKGSSDTQDGEIIDLSPWQQSSYIYSCLCSLVAHTRRRETVLGILAMAGAFIGGLGLLLLSIFDTKRYSSAHRAFLLVFIIGVALSAIFTILEVSFCYLIKRALSHIY